MKILVSLILLTLLSTPSFAKDKKKRKMKEIFNQLNLSDKQLEKIKKHRKSNKGKMKELRSQIKETREQIKTSFVADSSTKDLNSLHLQMNMLRSKVANLRFSKMLLFKDTLTQEQRRKFISLKQKYKKKD